MGAALPIGPDPRARRRSPARALPLRSLVLLTSLLTACAAGGTGEPDAGAATDAGGPTSARDAGPRPPPGVLPALLSQTGLFAQGASGDLADGILTFEVRHTSWVDDSAKSRHLWLPPGTAIDTTDPDAWRFPVGTRIWKQFFVNGRTVETRLIQKDGPGDGDWTYVSYVYRADREEADAAPEGASDVLGTDHEVPDQAGCFECHQGARDFALGLSAIQITRASFDRLLAAGALPSGTTFGEVPGTPVERDALGYLHANCGHCHRDGHPVSERRDLRLDLRVGLRDVAESNAYLTAVDGIATDRVDGTRLWVVPGDPAMSQIVARMGQRSPVGMPPRFTEQVDARGVDLVSRWITALP